jgi:hypothetical protein
MKKYFIVIFMAVFSVLGVQAQQTVKGIVLNSDTEKAMANVKVSVQGTSITVKTPLNGVFILKNVPKGKQVIEIYLNGFERQLFPITISDKSIDLGEIILYEDIDEESDLSEITLSDDELSDDEGGADNTSGLLQSSKDVFVRATAFNFPWFRSRGYDSDNAVVLMNGIKMNKVSTGRPQWSDWGGLNDVLRNQVFTYGLAPADNTFGGILGSTAFNTRASAQRKGSRISAASSNRSYQGRAMITHNTGMNDKGWAFSFSASRRYATQGYYEGSTYNAWSGFIAAEKKLSNKHSLNLTALYTPNRRGKSSPNTQEVYDLKGLKYNAYWGYQGVEKRNSRIKEIKEPLLILSHYWSISDKTNLNTNVGYQTGSVGNSRIGYFRALNPDPTYYQKLPSYALAHNSGPNYTEYYDNLTNFKKNGQIKWFDLYNANETIGGNAAYYLYEDRNDDTTISANTNLMTEITDNIILNGRLNYSKLESGNFGNMLDLLGAQYFTDLDQYAPEGSPEEQNNLNDPNRQVTVGDKFLYNYKLYSSAMDAFLQAQFSYDKIDFFVSGKYATTSHQREGMFKNGSYPTTSFGKSEKLTFNDASFKGGITYKITGRHLINVNGGYLSVAPTLRNTFANARVNNQTIPNVTSQKITSIDASYIFRAPGIKGRLTGYITDFKDAIETSFYFAQGIGSQGGDEDDFVGESVTGIEKNHKGIELGFEVQATPTIKLTAVAAVGEYKYANNPNLYLTSENENEFQDFGTTYLKGVNVAGTPRQAYSLGFEYRDPNYWWFGVNANYMMQNYLDISPVLRTNNFWKDVDGLPLINPETGNPVTQEEVDSLLIQEEFDGAFLLNAIGGKSWKIGNKYIGLFANVSNILGEVYKTGGFEQARNANFVRLQQQRNLETPTFGPKYWYGNQTTYYLNVYLRF